MKAILLLLKYINASCNNNNLSLGSYAAGDLRFSDYADATPADVSTFEDYAGGGMTHSFTAWVKPGTAPFF